MDRLAVMKTYRAVVETGGFSSAARRLSLSKAAVSKQVAELEADFGTALLHRTTRKLNVTEAGQRYFENCVRLIDELDAVEAEVRSAQAEPAGKLRVSAPINFGDRVLGPLVCALAERYPKLELQFELSDRFVNLIEDGFDAALRIRTSMPDSSLLARRLCRVSRSVCAAPAYLKRAGTPKTPKDLKDHQCLLYTLSATAQDWRFVTGGKTQSVRVNGAIQSNNGQFLLAPLRAGMGIACLPDFIVADDLKAGRLKRILVDFPVEDHDLYIVFPGNRHQSPKVRVFAEMAAQYLHKALERTGAQRPRKEEHERR